MKEITYAALSNVIDAARELLLKDDCYKFLALILAAQLPGICSRYDDDIETSLTDEDQYKAWVNKHIRSIAKAPDPEVLKIYQQSLYALRCSIIHEGTVAGGKYSKPKIVFIDNSVDGAIVNGDTLYISIADFCEGIFNASYEESHSIPLSEFGQIASDGAFIFQFLMDKSEKFKNKTGKSHLLIWINDVFFCDEEREDLKKWFETHNEDYILDLRFKKIIAPYEQYPDFFIPCSEHDPLYPKHTIQTWKLKLSKKNYQKMNDIVQRSNAHATNSNSLLRKELIKQNAPK